MRPTAAKILGMYRRAVKARGIVVSAAPIVKAALADVWVDAYTQGQADALRDAAAVDASFQGRMTRRELCALIPKSKRDGCERCHGLRGGVPGNENFEDGKKVCDYCSSDGGLVKNMCSTCSCHLKSSKVHSKRACSHPMSPNYMEITDDFDSCKFHDVD